MPGGAPEPEVGIADFGRFGPDDAVFGEPDHRIVGNGSLAVAFAVSGSGCKHQFTARGMGDFGIAEIQFREGEVGERLPLLAVFTGEDPDGTISGHMGAAFAENTNPIVFVANEIGEGTMRGAIPNAGAFDSQQRKSKEKK